MEETMDRNITIYNNHNIHGWCSHIINKYKWSSSAICDYSNITLMISYIVKDFSIIKYNRNQKFVNGISL